MDPAAKRILRLPDGLTLYFSRHGETEANVAKRFQGHTIDTPLTERGLKQTKTIAKILKARVDDPAALKCVASPLPRTRLTMMLIRDHLGLSIDGFKTDKRICEIDLGKWDGLTHRQARKLDPKLFDRREADKWNVRVPGGEDYADVANRAEQARALPVARQRAQHFERGVVRIANRRSQVADGDQHGAAWRVAPD